MSKLLLDTLNTSRRTLITYSNIYEGIKEKIISEIPSSFLINDFKIPVLAQIRDHKIDLILSDKSESFDSNFEYLIIDNLTFLTREESEYLIKSIFEKFDYKIIVFHPVNATAFGNRNLTHVCDLLLYIDKEEIKILKNRTGGMESIKY